ncbi:MAG: urease accessory protein UreD [Verrucomicrobia bacterium]|nr:urease accessory protein UreD [Verrucomicrobiota bacterium]
MIASPCDIMEVAAPVPPADRAPRAGHASVRVERVEGLSALTSSYATSPMKMLAPKSRGPSVWVYGSSHGGGVVAGDQTRLEVEVGRGACCFAGTQASTKIYRNPALLPSTHHTQARVARGGLLVFTPETVQLFAGSSHRQTQRFELESDASLVVLDWFSCGRVACGERWEFSSYSSRNEVLLSGHGRLFLDATRIIPGGDPSATGHLPGPYTVFATLFLDGPRLRESAALLVEDVARRPVRRRASTLVSASRMGSGPVVLRAASTGIEDLSAELHRWLKPVFDLLEGDPWSRRN